MMKTRKVNIVYLYPNMIIKKNYPSHKKYTMMTNISRSLSISSQIHVTLMTLDLTTTRFKVTLI